jgi:hypothetical protein
MALGINIAPLSSDAIPGSSDANDEVKADEKVEDRKSTQPAAKEETNDESESVNELP